jgi:hypothetical protein
VQEDQRLTRHGWRVVAMGGDAGRGAAVYRGHGGCPAANLLLRPSAPPLYSGNRIGSIGEAVKPWRA